MHKDLGDYLKSEENSDSAFSNDVKNKLHIITLDDFVLGYRNSDFQAWDRCYNAFKNARENNSITDDKCKKLCFALIDYLENWGMYGRKAILTKHRKYTAHTKAVKISLSQKYSDLQGLSLDDWNKHRKLAKELYDELDEYYKNKLGKSSETLITKVMLGTLACVPALDENINRALRKNFRRQRFSHSIEKISALIALCKEKNFFDHNIPKCLKNMEHTDMKILDFCLFFYGKQI